MRTTLPAPLRPLVLCALVAPVRAADPADLRDVIDAALDGLVSAASECGRADGPGADARLAAVAGLLGDGLAEVGDHRALRADLVAALRHAERARDRLAETPGGLDARRPVRSIGRAATAIGRALLRLGPPSDGTCALVETTPGSSWIHGPARRATFRVLASTIVGTVTLNVVPEDEDVVAVEPSVRRLGTARFRVRWGASLGGARLVATHGASTSDRPVFNRGPRMALALAPPDPPEYPAGPAFARVGVPLGGLAPQAQPGVAYRASGLPTGLAIDARTGAVSGTPVTSGAATTVRVTVRNARGAAETDLVVDVDPALPDGVVELAGGFRAERMLGGLDVPVRMALAPDGRLYFNELATGNVRVAGVDGALRPEPVVTVPVLTGVERGLLGLALAPDFATSGELYVFASTAAGEGKPDRNRVLRYRVTGDLATGPEVVVDDLPIGATLNAGDVQFGGDGHLYVTTGATGDDDERAALPQTDGSLAGRVLRFARDGSVPADNPVPGSPEWARGFRNPFDLAWVPSAGGFLAIDNGTDAHDELNFVQRGRNFGWGAEPGASFGALTGIRVREWTPVIAPTCVAVPSSGWDAGTVFLGSYDAVEVRLLVLDGVDLRSEEPLVRFDPEVFENRPLDLVVTAGGDLLVSTFDAIWRVVHD
jgi:glucose/arabinose dehydrogenase